eukprot:PhF_6_TR6302/c0_g1_i2/m.9550
MLTRSLYRNVLKSVKKVHSYYGNNLQKTSLSIFGPSIDPEYWTQCAILYRESRGSSSSSSSTDPHVDAVKYYFRNQLPILATERVRSLVVFDVLKRMNSALEQAIWDEGLTTLALRRGEVVFQVKAFTGEAKVPPLPRLMVEGDPFWAVQMSLPPLPFYFREAFVWNNSAANSNTNNSGGVIHNTTTTVTNDIEITVTTEHVTNASSADSKSLKQAKNVFEYRVRIKNLAPPGGLTVQVLSRHWYFLDWDHSEVVEVVGKGLVGRFPNLRPGEEHTYVSGTDLKSSNGVMRGCFQFARFRSSTAASDVSGTSGTSTNKETTKDSATPKDENEGDEDGTDEIASNEFVDMVNAFIAPTLLRVK